MGTPAFAVSSLNALVDAHDVVAVLTQPDRPAGRGHKLAPSPVKLCALEHGLPVYQPETLRFSDSKEIRAVLREYDADIFVVAAYGLILPKGILEMPRLGCINVHASLLPKYRGASPIHATILNGDKKAGITIMHMDVGLDTGDMIVKKELDVEDKERFASLHDRMAVCGASALLEALKLLDGGNAPRIAQDDERACYAPIIKKTDALINWTLDTTKIVNMTRAYDPWPGTYTMYDGKALKIWSAHDAGSTLGDISPDIQPGTVIAADSQKGVLIKTGDGALWATELQGDGSKRMSATEYLRGRRVDVGAVLDMQ